MLGEEQAQQGLPRSVELQRTPFYPQQDYQCGPAALATVLTDSGIATSPQDLVAQVYIPGRAGSLQIELLAAARRAGRLPYLIEPNLGALLAELAAGRPVLILQNLGLGFAPVWHYAVVVGYDTDSGELILRSGTTERRRVPAAKFARSWRASEQWGVVVLRPGELPVAPSRKRYLQAVNALEQAGHADAALAAYLAAAERWPDSANAWFALANAYYAAGQWGAAERGYRTALERSPDDAAAWNNLAQLLLSQHRCTDAQAALDRGLAVEDTAPAISSALASSADAIANRCPGTQAGQ
ncbi:MAG: PA2778 family cysteine peptidase [Chromatiales bacterium]|nr:MAG: PA2778 family cysteine peptidase [Chromatiales bacterium]